VTSRHLDVACARLEDLATVREMVKLACNDAGAPREVRDALVLATDEVCSNIVLHAYGVDTPGPMRVAVDVGAGAGAHATITITDAAPPFDPVAAGPAPDLGSPWDTRSIGGLGLFLVRKLMDEVRYERQPAGNCVTLVKHLDGGAVPHT
jgi:serine/threonine-protein kinase RsbW